MALQDYLALRNGTDVRGVVLENEYNEKINLTTEITENISRAFCMWLTEKTGNADLHIAVGYDSRLSSPMLCQAVLNGIVDMGHTAVSTGLSTTPSMFMLLKDERQNRAFSYDGSIMITASHLPFHRNGLKFFTQRGGLDGEDVKEILTLETVDGEMFGTVSDTFKREFDDIVGFFGDDVGAIRVIGRTSKNGRKFITCTVE